MQAACTETVELLNEVDVLSGSCPTTPETKGDVPTNGRSRGCSSDLESSCESGITVEETSGIQYETTFLKQCRRQFLLGKKSYRESTFLLSRIFIRAVAIKAGIPHSKTK